MRSSRGTDRIFPSTDNKRRIVHPLFHTHASPVLACPHSSWLRKTPPSSSHEYSWRCHHRLRRNHAAKPSPRPRALRRDESRSRSATQSSDARSASRDTGITVTSTNYEEIVTRDDVQAVIIATPNFLHAPIALAAIAAGKHVLSEKPLAMNHAEAQGHGGAADAAGVRHMTAFTYRFVPAMRYLGHLIARGDLGQAYHFRSCRLQDWGTRNLGWRQEKKLAGTGELGDMLSHRIDFAQHLVGPMKRLVARREERSSTIREGHPSDLDDWVAILAEFQNGATGVLESSKLASGRQRDRGAPRPRGVQRQRGDVEIHHRKVERTAMTASAAAPAWSRSPIPREFWVWPGSPARSRGRRSADRLPLRSGVGVHRRHPQATSLLPSFHDGARRRR